MSVALTQSDTAADNCSACTDLKHDDNLRVLHGGGIDELSKCVRPMKSSFRTAALNHSKASPNPKFLDRTKAPERPSSSPLKDYRDKYVPLLKCHCLFEFSSYTHLYNLVGPFGPRNSAPTSR